MNREILRLQSITQKVYGTKILSNIYFNLFSGEIHGIIGKNGSGKTALAQVMAGRTQNYEGVVFLENRKLEGSLGNAELRRKVSLVPQELCMVENMTVAEYIYTLRRESSHRILQKRKKIEKDTENLLGDMGISINAKDIIGNLSRSQKKFVEIAKSFARHPLLAVFDDADIGMEPNDIALFWKIIQKQSSRGISCVVITQDLSRMCRNCSRITIMRNGRIAGTVQAGEYSREHIVNLVLGSKMRQKETRPEIVWEEEVLRLDGIGGEYLHGISFSLLKGEILGITGADDAGKEELGEMLYGCMTPAEGSIYLEGKPVKLRNPSLASKQGIRFLPGDRRRFLLGDQSIRDNIIFATLHIAKNKLGFLKPSIVKYLVRNGETDIAKLDENPIREAANGIQQKLLFLHWQAGCPKLLILNHPTNSLESGDRVKVMEMIRQYSFQGTSVLLLTNDLEELVSLCHRVLVLSKGGISGEVHKSQLSEQSVTKLKMEIT